MMVPVVRDGIFQLQAIMSIRLIVGLGNPGPEYEQTRHNAGFWVADNLENGFHGNGWQKEAKFSALVSRAKIGGHGDDVHRADAEGQHLVQLAVDKLARDGAVPWPGVDRRVCGRRSSEQGAFEQGHGAYLLANYAISQSVFQIQ